MSHRGVFSSTCSFFFPGCLSHSLHIIYTWHCVCVCVCVCLYSFAEHKLFGKNSLCGRQSNSLPEMSIPNPGTYEHVTLHSKRNFADSVILRPLTWMLILGHLRGPSASTGVLKIGRGRQRGSESKSLRIPSTIDNFEDGGRGHSRGIETGLWMLEKARQSILP